MRCLTPSLIFVLVASGAPLSAQKDSAPQAAFNKGLASVGRLIGRAKWKAARTSLDKLLEKHRDASYARAKTAEIADMIRRCAFGLKYKTPDPDDLVTGKILKYRASTGQIKIKYTPTTARDLQRAEGMIFFPASFTGPWTLDIKGRKYPARAEDSPYVVVGTKKGTAFSIIFGSPPRNVGSNQEWLPARIIKIEKRVEEELVTKEISFARPGKPYNIKIKVTRGAIIPYLNGKSFGQARKSKKHFGEVGFKAYAWSEVVIAGKIEPSWIQARMDAAIQKNQQEFAKSYVPSQHVPDWLFKNPDPVRPASFRDKAPYPDDVKPAHLAALRKVADHYPFERYREGLVQLEKLSDTDAPESARTYLAARFRLALGDLQGALASASRSIELQPRFLKTRVLKAMALEGLDRIDEAAETWREATDVFPKELLAYEEAARLLMQGGRFEKAKAVVELALTRSLRSDGLTIMNTTLVKALTGPRWGKTYEYRSPNYLILSDIDRATCKEASRLLEESYTAYRMNLSYIKKGKTRRFKVLLFSGQAGYLAYTKDLWGVAPTQSAGVYIPMIKQLLIWNLPDREEMMRTVRHEGFHQYLDRVMKDPPLWFNEGMAEYHATARLVQGSLRGGQKRPEYLELLRGQKLVPLKKFLFQGPREFYSNGEKSYAQAWALVHLLRHGDADKRKLFKQLMERLQGTATAEKTVRSVFSGRDLRVLDRQLVAYIKTL